MNLTDMESIFWSRSRLSRDGVLLLLAVLAFPAAASSAGSLADLQFRKVSSVSIKADGVVDEPFLLDLIEITPNVDILTTSKVRRSIELLYATGNFTNILVDAQQDGDRVALTFVLRLIYRFQYVHLRDTLGVSGSAIRQRLRLRKLEPYTPEKILTGRDDILAVLRENGYYGARVQQDVLLHRSAKLAEVTYQITAGQPAYYGAIAFSGSPYFSEAALRLTMKAATGRRFREPQFQKDLVRIEALYDANGFLEHDIKVARRELDAQNRMQVEIAINSGKQLILTVEGIALSKDTIRDQLPIWADHSYNDDTLEEGKRNLFLYMQTRGYYDATVEWEKLFEKDNILIKFKVKPGTMYELSEIRIHGNDHFPKDEILELMKTKESGVFSTGRLVTRTFESDIDNILSAYREKGFLFARVVKQDVVRAPAGKLILDLEINEEQQVFVADIRIKGNSVIPTSYFLEHFHQKIGEPVSESKVKNDSNYIVALYSDRGYPKIKLENKLLLGAKDKTRAVIEYRVDEGEQVFVDRIVISGNYRTRRGVITRNLFFAEDDPLSLRKIQESQSRLYSLQIFDRVDIAMPRPDSLNQYQEVLMNFTETKPYTVSYGIGYETFNKLRGVFTLSNRNWLGTGRGTSFQIQGGFKEGRVLLNYSDPILFSNRTLSTLSVFAEKRVRPSFSYRSYGVTIQVEKKLSPERAAMEVGLQPPPQKSLFFGYIFQDIDTYGIPDPSPENRQFLAIHISAPTASFARDARDNAIDPTTGTFFSTDLEWSTSFLGSQTDYLKSFTWGQYYHPVGGTVFATSLRLGLAEGFYDTIKLPISQRFFAGGGRTIRGFELDTAGPLTKTGDPKGGNMMFILNLENRFPIYGNLGGLVFFDWGNVFPLIGDFSLSGLRKTTGLGIRYKTALGPVIFDWGYKLDRKKKESAYEFYLSIGNAF